VEVSIILQVSRGTIQSRLDRLISSDAILGFGVRLREVYGLHALRALMLIEVTVGSTMQVIRQLRGISELLALHTTNGAWDLIVEIQTGKPGRVRSRVARRAYARRRVEQLNHPDIELHLNRRRWQTNLARWGFPKLRCGVESVAYDRAGRNPTDERRPQQATREY
jgi:DNA-binding Lrp family transcriptional regulator